MWKNKTKNYELLRMALHMATAHPTPGADPAKWMRPMFLSRLAQSQSLVVDRGGPESRSEKLRVLVDSHDSSRWSS